MSDFKYIMDSSLEEMKFSDAKKQEVLEKCKNRKENWSEKGLPRFSMRYAGVVAVCLVLCIGGTVAAKVLLWDDFVAERYQVETEEELQKETMAEGLATTMIVSDEDNGITVEVLQTVANQNHIDIYLKIKAANEEIAKQIADAQPIVDISFENSEWGGINGGMVSKYTGIDMKTEITEYYTIENQEWMTQEMDYAIYNLSVDITNAGNLNEDIAYLNINYFVRNSQDSPYVLAEGDWELSWKVKASESKKTIVFNKEYEMYEKTFKLHKIELSPIGIKVYIDRELIDKEELMTAFCYIIAKPSGSTGDVTDNVPGWEYEYLEWRGINGIPLAVYKELTQEERFDVVEEISNGTYKGDYVDVDDWCAEKDHYVISTWDSISIRMKDGKAFCPKDSTGSSDVEGNNYVITENYVGYLDIENVSEIWIGNCVIPLSDGEIQ